MEDANVYPIEPVTPSVRMEVGSVINHMDFYVEEGETRDYKFLVPVKVGTGNTGSHSRNFETSEYVSRGEKSYKQVAESGKHSARSGTDRRRTGPKRDSSKEEVPTKARSKRLLTYEEIKLSQAEKRLESLVRQQSILLRKWGMDWVNKELHELMTELKKITKEKVALEKEKIELLKGQRERYRDELAAVKRLRADVFSLKQRIGKQDQLSSAPTFP